MRILIAALALLLAPAAAFAQDQTAPPAQEQAAQAAAPAQAQAAMQPAAPVVIVVPYVVFVPVAPAHHAHKPVLQAPPSTTQGMFAAQPATGVWAGRPATGIFAAPPPPPSDRRQ